MRNITFSYNSAIMKSKADGAPITQFKSLSFDLDDPLVHDKLKSFFNQHVYSLNRWIGKDARGQKLDPTYEGYAIEKNYAGMYGIALDYDDGHFTFEQARKAFSNYVHIIHASSSNMLDNPRHRGVQPRFRVILPFDLTQIPYLMDNKVDGELVYEYLRSKYPEADGTVFSTGRKLYPFTGDPSLYEFYLNIPDKPVEGSSSIFYSLGHEELEQFRDMQVMKSSNKRAKGAKKLLDPNDVVVLPDRRTKKRISEIDKSNTQVFCCFCDDLESESPSGIINIDKMGNYNLHCFHCKQTYWEQNLKWDSEKEPGLFFDSNAGYPAVYNRHTGHLKFFRTTPDWENYCQHEGLNKEIYKQLPRAHPVMDPKKPTGLNGNIFNLYLPSEYLEDYDIVQERIKNKQQRTLNITGLPHVVPMIWHILKNVIGADADIERYLNWLGYIIQYREQSTLAWIIISKPGSGKGLLVERILRPIFGHHAVLIEEGSGIGAQFNFEDASCLIKVYNEVFTQHDFHLNLKRREWLKNRIGTNEILLEQKFMDKTMFKNFVNYMLLSNQNKAFLIEADDRRLNVVNTLKTSCKIVDTKWYPGTKKQFEDQIAAEVPLFAEYIQNIEVNEYLANNTTDTPARLDLIEHSQEDVDFIIGKLNHGEADYFELATIFPSTRALLGVDPNSEIRAEIEYYIKNYYAIPSKYATEVFSHFVKLASRTNVKRKLEQHGIILSHQIWDKAKQANVRVYIHESKVK